MSTKKVLIVGTSEYVVRRKRWDFLPSGSLITGAWCSEIGDPVNEFGRDGYQVEFASPKGIIRLDPRSQRWPYLTRFSRAQLVYRGLQERLDKTLVLGDSIDVQAYGSKSFLAEPSGLSRFQ